MEQNETLKTIKVEVAGFVVIYWPFSYVCTKLCRDALQSLCQGIGKNKGSLKKIVVRVLHWFRHLALPHETQSFLQEQLSEPGFSAFLALLKINAEKQFLEEIRYDVGNRTYFHCAALNFTLTVL